MKYVIFLILVCFFTLGCGQGVTSPSQLDRIYSDHHEQADLYVDVVEKTINEQHFFGFRLCNRADQSCTQIGALEFYEKSSLERLRYELFQEAFVSTLKFAGGFILSSALLVMSIRHFKKTPKFYVKIQEGAIGLAKAAGRNKEEITELTAQIEEWVLISDISRIHDKFKELQELIKKEGKGIIAIPGDIDKVAHTASKNSSTWTGFFQIKLNNFANFISDKLGITSTILYLFLYAQTFPPDSSEYDNFEVSTSRLDYTVDDIQSFVRSLEQSLQHIENDTTDSLQL